MAERQPAPRYMTIDSCADLISRKTRIVIVCGAGLSAGVAPLAQAIEDGLWSAVTALAHGENAVDLHGALATGSEIQQEYCTLELFVSGLRNRVPCLREPLLKLYEELFRIQHPSRTHVALAKALSAKPAATTGAPSRAAGDPIRCVSVLTSNFDNGLTKALHHVSGRYRLVTDANVAAINTRDQEDGARAPADGGRLWMYPGIDVCAYHGTVDDQRPLPEDVPPEGGRNHTAPTSMAARDLAHPFAPQMSAYVKRVLQAAATDPDGLVLFLGHRGEDFYDLNLEIETVLGPPGSEERRRKIKNFLCIPHRGRSSEVSEFYEKTFTKEVFVVLVGAGEQWLADLCDKVADPSGGPKPPVPGSGAAPAPSACTAKEVGERFLGLVNDAFKPDDDAGKARRAVIAKQCEAFLSDIRSGVFAAWSVTEHYRLESLAYPAEQIAAFGRPSRSRRFHGVPLAELITLQEDYKTVRKAINEAIERHDGSAMLGRALDLMVRFEAFSRTSLEALGTIARTDHLQLAMAALLAAIGYDYAGLLAMRCATVKHTLPDLAGRVPDTWEPIHVAIAEPPLTSLARLEASGFTAGLHQRTRDLFVASIALANWSAVEVKSAAGAVGLSDPDEIAQYEERLAQIVAWEDWTLAPAENLLRLPLQSGLSQADRDLALGEMIARYGIVIERRIERIEAAVGDVDEKSFSAAADSAQCVQRLSEAMRHIMNVEEKGEPGAISDKRRTDYTAFVENVEKHAGYCLDVDGESSSVRNHRFMAAHDALVLAALFRGGDDAVTKAETLILDAKNYAKPNLDGHKEWRSRLTQVESRVSA